MAASSRKRRWSGQPRWEDALMFAPGYHRGSTRSRREGFSFRRPAESSQGPASARGARKDRESFNETRDQSVFGAVILCGMPRALEPVQQLVSVCETGGARTAFCSVPSLPYSGINTSDDS